METELPFLANGFDEVFIYSSAHSTITKRDLPENVKSVLFSIKLSNWDKLKALTGVFSMEFRTEKKRVREVYKQEWSRGIRNTALISLFIGKRWKNELEKEIERSKGIDLTFYSYWCTDTALGLALLSQSNPAVKTISRVHGWDLYFEATAFNYQPYRELIAHNLTCLYPISRKGERYIRDRWKVNPNALRMARLGTREVKEVQSNRKRNIVVSCSNLIPLKRVSLIAESLQYVDQVDLEWYHFGDGPKREKIEKLSEMSRREGVKIHLMGRKSNDEILRWFEENAPNLFINVSESEGVPVSIMEAMSFGTPVFATDVGGTSEIVSNENGRLLQPDITPEELGGMIQAFFLKYDDRFVKRSNAFETWKTKYNASVNYKRFVEEIVG